ELRRESERHRGSTQDTMSIELNAYSSDGLLHKSLFDSPQFQEWLASTKTLDLFLDGLDESLIHIRTVATLLAHEFGKYPTSRLRLRIACRTAEWPSLLRDQFQKLWNSYEELEVAPLRRIHVERSASM